MHVPLAAALGLGGCLVAESWIHMLALGAAAVGCALLVVVDAVTHRLPRIVLIPTYTTAVPLLAGASVWSGDWSPFWRALISGIALGLFYLLLGLVSPSGIGFGDVTFAPLLGIVLGWFGWAQPVVATTASFTLAAIAALTLMALRRARGSTRIAFGPWMVAGAASAFLLFAGLEITF